MATNISPDTSTIAGLRLARPEFDQLGYSDEQVVMWLHNGMGGDMQDHAGVKATANSLGYDTPDTDVGNAFSQGMLNVRGAFKAFQAGVFGMENDPDFVPGPARAGMTPENVAEINTRMMEPDLPPQLGGTGLAGNIAKRERITDQVLGPDPGKAPRILTEYGQQKFDEREALQHQAQLLSLINSNPQSWEEVKFGGGETGESGILDYISNLVVTSGPEMATMVVGGLPGALIKKSVVGSVIKSATIKAGAFGANLPVGIGHMAGAQYDEHGRIIDMDKAVGLGAAYSAINLLPGAEASLLRPLAGDLTRRTGVGVTQNVIRKGTAGGIGEAVQEVAQTALERESAGLDLTSPEALAQYKEAGIGGFFAGKTISGTTSLLDSPASPNVNQPPPPGAGPAEPVAPQLGPDPMGPPAPAQFQGPLQQAPVQGPPNLSGAAAVMSGVQPPSGVPAAMAAQPAMAPVPPTEGELAAQAINTGQQPPTGMPAAMAQAAAAVAAQESGVGAPPTQTADTPAVAAAQPTPSAPAQAPTPGLPSKAVAAVAATDPDAPVVEGNVAQAMADVVKANPDTKYTNADLDWANKNLVGKTPAEIAAVPTRSPKRTQIIEQLAALAPEIVPETAPESAPAATPAKPSVHAAALEAENAAVETAKQAEKVLAEVEAAEVKPVKAEPAPKKKTLKLKTKPKKKAAPKAVASPAPEVGTLAGFETTLSKKEGQVFAELRNNPDATSQEIADVIGGTYQAVQQAQTRMNRKMERYAEKSGSTVDQLADSMKADAATKSDKSKPVDTSKTTAKTASKEDLAEAGGMGVIDSPGKSQASTAATTKDQKVMDSLTGKPVQDADTYLEQNDPQSKTAQKHVGEFWTQEREGIEGMPPWRDLSAAEREAVTTAYQKAIKGGKAMWQPMVTAGKKRIAGKIVGDSDAAIAKLRAALLNAANDALADFQAPTAPKADTTPVAPAQTTEARDYQVAKAAFNEPAADPNDHFPADWSELSDRQKDIFQLEVERLINSAGATMSDLQLNKAVQAIKARVLIDGGAYYDSMYHRSRERKVEGMFGGGSSVAQVERMIAKAQKTLNKLIPINVVQSVSDLPKRLDGVKHPTTAAGLIQDGQIYLVADNIRNKRDASETLAHEVVGHLGIDSMLSGKDWDATMKAVNDLIAEGDPSVMPIVQALHEEYRGTDGQYNLSPTQQAREVLAHLAQHNPNFGLVRQVVAKLRVALAKLGIGNINAAQLNALIVNSGRYVQSSGFSATNNTTPAYARKAIAGIKKTDPARYKKTLADLMNTLRDPQAIQATQERWGKRFDKIQKRLGKYLPANGDEFINPKDWPMADVYTTAMITQFMTKENGTTFTEENMTPLSAIRDTTTGYTKIAYYVDAELGGFDGLVMQVIASPDGAGVLVAPEKYVGDIVGDERMIGQHNALAGVVLDKAFSIDIEKASHIEQINKQLAAKDKELMHDSDITGEALELVATGPSLHNADFREAYLADPENTNFEVYPYANVIQGDVRLENSQQSLGMSEEQIEAEVARRSKVKETDPRNVVVQKFHHYVRFNGFGQIQAAELGRIVTRAHTSAAKLDKPVDQVFTRATGGNVGRAGHMTSEKVQAAYHRRSRGTREKNYNDLQAQIKRAWKATKNKIAPELLTMKGLHDVYGKALPTLKKYYKNLSLMEAMQTTLSAEANAVASRWSSLKDGMREKVNDLALDATMEGVHPDVPLDHAANKHAGKEQKAAWPALNAKWNALTPEAQNVYAEARDKMRKDWESRGQVYEDVVNLAYADVIAEAKTPEKKAEAEKARDDAIKANKEVIASLKGPYFPLMRFGKYLTILKSKKMADLEATLDDATKAQRVEINKKLDLLKRSKTDYKVAAFDNEVQAGNAFEAAKAEGNWYMPDEKDAGGSYMKLADAADPKQREITKLGMDKVKAYLSDNVDGDTAKQLNTMLAELYVGSLPENNTLARELRRQGIEGAETNMLRSFAASTEKMSFYLSRMKYRDKLAEDLADLKTETQAAGKVNDISASAVHAQVLKRYRSDNDFVETPIQNFVARLSGLNALGSPSYWAVNMSQPWLIGGPVIAAEFGMTKTMAELGKGMKTAMKMLEATVSADGSLTNLNWDKGDLTADEKAFMQEMVEHGRISINITAELGALAKSPGSAGAVMDRVSNLVMWPATQVETVNRVMTALAAYRLAREDGQNPEKASHTAEDMLIDSQIDYSNVNAPHIMKAGTVPIIGKLMFQFRKYQHAMAQLLVLNAVKGLQSKKGMSKAEVKEVKQARALMAYLFGSMAITSGIAGLPGIAIAYWAADMLIDEDDEEGNAETQMRNAITDVVGQEMQEVLVKGLPSMIGMDLSKRTGMGDIFSPAPYLRTEARTGEDLLGRILVNILGAAAGMAKNFIDAGIMVNDGQPMRGLETAIPLKFARDTLRAVRYGNEGLTTRSRSMGVDPSGFTYWDLFQKSMGFSPLKETEYYEARSARANTVNAILDVKSDILRDLAVAKIQEDDALVEQLEAAMEAFNEKHPEFRADGGDRRRSFKNKRRTWQVDESGYSRDLFEADKLRDITRFAE